MRIASTALVAVMLTASTAAAQQIPQDRLRTAARQALVLLENTSPTFIKTGGCNSCHNQFLPAAAQAFAKSHGVPTGTPLAQLPPEVSEATTERYIEYSIAGGGGVPALGFDFFASAMAGKPATDHMRAELYFVKGMQRPDGSWARGAGDRRPPLIFDEFTPTAFMVFALNRYAPAVDAADTQARIARARAWLAKTPAERTQERSFKVLGLAWSNADQKTIATAVKDLRALQNRNGGWSQLATMETDAYATGMALYALSVAGVPAKDAAYQAGLNYLLSTQATDGTWHVKTRSLPLQPYFETGYPYDHDQWISAAGAAYATLAISAALDTTSSTQVASAR